MSFDTRRRFESRSFESPPFVGSNRGPAITCGQTVRWSSASRLRPERCFTRDPGLDAGRSTEGGRTTTDARRVPWQSGRPGLDRRVTSLQGELALGELRGAGIRWPTVGRGRKGKGRSPQGHPLKRPQKVGGQRKAVSIPTPRVFLCLPARLPFPQPRTDPRGDQESYPTRGRPGPRRWSLRQRSSPREAGGLICAGRRPLPLPRS